MRQRLTKKQSYAWGVTAACLVVVAGTSALRPNSTASPASTQPVSASAGQKATTSSNHTSLPAAQAETPADPEPEPAPAPSSNNTSASTTVTVNGDTVQINGANEHYSSSYTSPDGSSHVDISIDHSSTSDTAESSVTSDRLERHMR